MGMHARKNPQKTTLAKNSLSKDKKLKSDGLAMELRDYQKECINLIDDLERGKVLVCMATGLGKTVVFSHIKRRGRVLIVSHREELVRQPTKYYDCPCGIEQGAEKSHGEEVVSASVQSLIRRLDKFAPDDFDMIITDEAHHAAAPSYKKIYSYFTPRIHVGFTATPNRGDKVRLDDVFDRILFRRDLLWGIKNGWLTDVKCIRVDIGYDVSGVKERAGDFIAKDLDEAVNLENANGRIAEVYKKYARGQTLIFATSVSHAENIAAKIDGAVVVSQKTEGRKSIIDDFTAGKIKCLVNCMIFTEGTDLPVIETIIIARPTHNQSLYTQMVGRGLRQSKGKEYLTLIDCVGICGKLSICTAPDLMGIDPETVPPRNRKKIQGMLTDMREICDSAADCPEAWIANATAVKLFAEEQGVYTRKINWTKKPNGDLVYQLSCGDRIGIKAIDELAKTCVMRYRYDEKADRFVYEESPRTDLQDALDYAYKIFEKEYADERRFWDLTEYYGWQFEKATQKQLDYIKKVLSEEDFSAIDVQKLTKGDAVQIINAVSVRRLSPSDLRRMHARSAREKEEREKIAKALRTLKIRKIMSGKYSSKYYAIQHPTDLIITNDWQTASNIIAELNATGIECRFKSFTSIKQAEEYLRTPQK